MKSDDQEFKTVNTHLVSWERSARYFNNTIIAISILCYFNHSLSVSHTTDSLYWSLHSNRTHLNFDMRISLSKRGSDRIIHVLDVIIVELLMHQVLGYGSCHKSYKHRIITINMNQHKNLVRYNPIIILILLLLVWLVCSGMCPDVQSTYIRIWVRWVWFLKTDGDQWTMFILGPVYTRDNG